jgi:hypothetical protein
VRGRSPSRFRNIERDLTEPSFILFNALLSLFPFLIIPTPLTPLTPLAHYALLNPVTPASCFTLSVIPPFHLTLLNSPQYFTQSSALPGDL